MASQPETGTYDAGVYQIEVADAVQGGVGGIDNMALLNLANRTGYLKTHVDRLESTGRWAVTTNSVDAFSVTLPVTVTSLTDGLMVWVRFNAANTTTTPTLNADTTGAKTVTKLGGQALAVGDIAGNLFEGLLRYNLANTRWELLNPAGGGFTSGTFTVSDNSGASLPITSSFFYRAHASFYLLWGELTYPSTANGATTGLAGFPFTSRANSFAVGGWLIPMYPTNGGVSGSPYYLYATQNAATALFRDQTGTQPINSTFSTLRMGFNSQVPR